MKKRIGLYLGAKTILANPGYLETLQDKLGLNLVILSFTGELPPQVLTLSPYDGAPPSEDRLRALTAQHLDGHPAAKKFDRVLRSAGPHMHIGGDDRELREAIRRIHAAGIEVWLLGGVWTANDFDVVMFCPSKEEVNRWYEAVYVHMATQYGADGVDVTHARYPMTSETRGLFLCTCSDCARAAASFGYDMAQMKADIQATLECLKRLDGKRLVALAKQGLGPTDLMQLLGMRPGVIAWFTFRAELLARNIKRFRDAVHKAAGQHFIFGADTYPASLAMFVGHNQARWSEFSDFASPLISHADIFPMKTLTDWATFLMGLFPNINEGEALQTIYRLVGYDSLALPTTIADFALGQPDCEFRHVPLRDLLYLDMAKARLALPPEIPSYPIIQGGGAPWMWPREIIEGIMADGYALGHNGFMLQGTKSLVDYPLKE